MSNHTLASEAEIIDEIISCNFGRRLNYTLIKEADEGFSVRVTDENDTLIAKDITRDKQKAIRFFESIAYGRVDTTTFFEVVDDFLAED